MGMMFESITERGFANWNTIWGYLGGAGGMGTVRKIISLVQIKRKHAGVASLPQPFDTVCASLRIPIKHEFKSDALGIKMSNAPSLIRS